MSILESLVHLNLATETVVQSTMYDGKQFSSSYQLRGYTECPKQVPTLSEGKQFPGQNLIIPRFVPVQFSWKLFVKRWFLWNSHTSRDFRGRNIESRTGLSLSYSNLHLLSYLGVRCFWHDETSHPEHVDMIMKT